MNIKKMTKDQLREIDSRLRFFIKSGDNAANKALDAGDIEEVDRLEAILDELIKFDGVIYSKIQTM